MSTLTAPTTSADVVDVSDPQPAEALADRVVADVVATLETLSAHLGVELGLFAALDRDDAATPAELAARSGIDERYATEWLEQQTAAGYLSCLNHAAPAAERRFQLAPGTADVLLRPDSGAYVGPMLGLVRGITDVLATVSDAFQTGSGVPYAAFGPHLRHGLADMNGASFDANIAGWIGALPDRAAALGNTSTPRILDLGCGVGRSTIALARAYPAAIVHGIDLDPASIAEAEAAAVAAGLADRVTFTVADAAGLAAEERYELVTIFEALHDMGDPVGALAAARPLLADGGCVYVADERTADAFGPDIELIERMHYGFSVLHCLPATLAEDAVIANGTVLRAPTVDGWARAAGFAGAQDLEVDDPFWRHYRLDPVDAEVAR